MRRTILFVDIRTDDNFGDIGSRPMDTYTEEDRRNRHKHTMSSARQAIAGWKLSGKTLYMRTMLMDDVPDEEGKDVDCLPDEDGYEEPDRTKAPSEGGRKRERDAIGFRMEDPESL